MVTRTLTSFNIYFRVTLDDEDDSRHEDGTRLLEELHSLAMDCHHSYTPELFSRVSSFLGSPQNASQAQRPSESYVGYLHRGTFMELRSWVDVQRVFEERLVPQTIRRLWNSPGQPIIFAYQSMISVNGRPNS